LKEIKGKNKETYTEWTSKQLKKRTVAKLLRMAPILMLQAQMELEIVTRMVPHPHLTIKMLQLLVNMSMRGGHPKQPHKGINSRPSSKIHLLQQEEMSK